MNEHKHDWYDVSIHGSSFRHEICSGFLGCGDQRRMLYGRFNRLGYDDTQWDYKKYKSKMWICPTTLAGYPATLFSND